MIIRHHQILSRYADQHRPMTPAGRFWVGYVAAVVLILLWVLV